MVWLAVATHVPTRRETIKSCWRWSLLGLVRNSNWKGSPSQKKKATKVCSWIVQAWNNLPVSIVIKAFIRAEITTDDGSANSSDSHCDLVVGAHMPLSHEAILALFCSNMEESDFSGFSALEDYVTIGFVMILLFTWMVKEQYVLMCSDALLKYLCRFFSTSFSIWVWLLIFSVCFSSLFLLFQCFVGNVYLVDSCALSAACTLYVIGVLLFFLNQGGRWGGVPYALQHLIGQKLWCVGLRSQDWLMVSRSFAFIWLSAGWGLVSWIMWTWSGVGVSCRYSQCLTLTCMYTLSMGLWLVSWIFDLFLCDCAGFCTWDSGHFTWCAAVYGIWGTEDTL